MNPSRAWATGLQALLLLLGPGAGAAEAPQGSDARADRAVMLLMARSGCLVGSNRALSRFDAAVLLNSCLERVGAANDALRALVSELAPERELLQHRIAVTRDRLNQLEAQQFSPTTRLSGQATMVLGGSAFNGSAINGATHSVTTMNAGALPLTDAISFNFDLQLNLDTSFNGQDLLRTVLRSGNFNSSSNSFNGGGPTSLSTLETAYQEPNGADLVGIYKLFYQVPLGRGFTATIGPWVGQEDMLAYSPSLYPSSTVLDVFTTGGAPVAINYNRGSGAGLWWQRNGWSLSASYVAANGSNGSPFSGGLATASAASTGTVQLAYHQEQWGLSALYAAVQNGVAPYGTLNLLANGLNGPIGNLTHALSLNANWQPAHNGWIPAISVGWGSNSTSYSAPVPAGTPLRSQSWSLGLQWEGVLAKGTSAGLAVGQAPFTTRQSGGLSPNDGNWMLECWTALQLSDAISLTPALFYLARPLGQETPAGQTFNQLGVLLKTQFRF